MDKPLKPCPFCGCQPLISENNVPGNWFATVECDSSDCYVSPGVIGHSIEDAKKQWSKRATLEATQAGESEPVNISAAAEWFADHRKQNQYPFTGGHECHDGHSDDSIRE